MTRGQSSRIQMGIQTVVTRTSLLLFLPSLWSLARPVASFVPFHVHTSLSKSALCPTPTPPLLSLFKHIDHSRLYASRKDDTEEKDKTLANNANANTYLSSKKRHKPQSHTPTTTRRTVVSNLLTTAITTTLLPSPSLATPSSQPNLQCLQDLPPRANPNLLRIYLCRHGQTEYNRLHKVQGARVDPPLNKTGRQMAQCLGGALGFLSAERPGVVAHSLLLRAKETAWIASRYGKGSVDADAERGMLCHPLPSLKEVDLGSPAEGQSVESSRNDRYQTFAAWSLGDIDAVPGPPTNNRTERGESGRAVLERTNDALHDLIQLASHHETRSIAAVSHSVFIRMLLALVLDVPPAQAMVQFPQENGCINVLDVDLSSEKKRVVRRTSRVLGGRFSRAPQDFVLEVPRVSVVRMNEVRHLEGVLL